MAALKFCGYILSLWITISCFHQIYGRGECKLKVFDKGASKGGEIEGFCIEEFDTSECLPFVKSFNWTDMPDGFPLDQNNDLMVEAPDERSAHLEGVLNKNQSDLIPGVVLKFGSPHFGVVLKFGSSHVDNSKDDVKGYLFIWERESGMDDLDLECRMFELNTTDRNLLLKDLVFSYEIKYLQPSQSFKMRLYTIPPPNSIEKSSNEKNFVGMKILTGSSVKNYLRPAEWTPSVSAVWYKKGSIEVTISHAPDKFNLTQFKVMLFKDSFGDNKPFRQQDYTGKHRSVEPFGSVMFDGLESGKYKIMVRVLEYEPFKDNHATCLCWVSDTNEDGKRCRNNCARVSSGWFFLTSNFNGTSTTTQLYPYSPSPAGSGLALNTEKLPEETRRAKLIEESTLSLGLDANTDRLTSVTTGLHAPFGASIDGSGLDVNTNGLTPVPTGGSGSLENFPPSTDDIYDKYVNKTKENTETVRGKSWLDDKKTGLAVGVSAAVLVLIGVLFSLVIRNWRRNARRRTGTLSSVHVGLSLSPSSCKSGRRLLADFQSHTALSKKTVYIVYAEDHDAHINLVEQLACFLQVHCYCDVIFPPWQNVHAVGHARWSRQNFQRADYILFVDSTAMGKLLASYTNNNQFCTSTDVSECLAHKLLIEASDQVFNNPEIKDKVIAVYLSRDKCDCQSNLLAPHTFGFPKGIPDFLKCIHDLNGKQADAFRHLLPLRVESFNELPEGKSILRAIEASRKFETEQTDWFIKRFGELRSMPQCGLLSTNSCGADILPRFKGSVSSQDMSQLDTNRSSEYDLFSVHRQTQLLPNRQERSVYTIGINMLNGSISQNEVNRLSDAPSSVTRTDCVSVGTLRSSSSCPSFQCREQ